MDYRSLGRTGAKVSPLCLGTMMFGDRTDAAEAANIVAAAELMRLRPESAEERLQLLLDQPHKAAETIAEFSREFETRLCLTRL